MGSMSPNTKSFLINKIIGAEIYKKLAPETKGYMLLEAIKQHHQEMIQKFGTWQNYFYDWCKRRGFESPYKYQQSLIRLWGFKSDNEYRLYCAKKRGFKSRAELFLMYAKKEGFDSLHQKYEDRYKKRGFKNQREYKLFLAKKHGFKNYSQLLRYNKELKNSQSHGGTNEK